MAARGAPRLTEDAEIARPPLSSPCAASEDDPRGRKGPPRPLLSLEPLVMREDRERRHTDAASALALSESLHEIMRSCADLAHLRKDDRTALLGVGKQLEHALTLTLTDGERA